MDRKTRRLVRERASNRCEYCQLPQEQSPVAKLQIEHIIPKKHGGADDLQNLALACIDCNLHKGSNLTGLTMKPVPSYRSITHERKSGLIILFGKVFC